MANVITTGGMTPFRVTVEFTAPAMYRFTLALAKTGAKVSASPTRTNTGMLDFVVWLKPVVFGAFQAWCRPLDFQFVSAKAIDIDGTYKP